MTRGDYQEKEITLNGKTSIEKIIKTVNNTEYVIGEEIGRGGNAIIKEAIRLKDGKEMAFKEFTINPLEKEILENLKVSVNFLINHPIFKPSEQLFNSFIAPLEFVELPESKVSGYIMEKVDSSKFVGMNRFFYEANSSPDALLLLNICENIAKLLQEIHLRTGYSYKDINLDNILINPKNGNIKLIDCENIYKKVNKTVFGTFGFIDPLVYKNKTPDIYSDRYALAVYFYKLLVDGYPLEGAKVVNYLTENGLSIFDEQEKVFGSDALFVFDRINNENSLIPLIRKNKNSGFTRCYIKWNYLPTILQDAFHKTFSEGLFEPHKRTSDYEWITTFKKVKKDLLIKCPKCHKFNFVNENKTNKCLYCKSELPNIEEEKANPKYRKVLFSILDNTRKVKKDINIPINLIIIGKQLSQTLSNNSLFKICVENNEFYIKNLSKNPWKVFENNKMSTLLPGRQQQLRSRQKFKLIDENIILEFKGLNKNE